MRPVQLSLEPLVADTPENREMLRRILFQWRHYFGEGPGSNREEQDWAREFHQKLSKMRYGDPIVNNDATLSRHYSRNEAGIRAYFVTKAKGRSPYAQGEDFFPELPGRNEPQQLHATEKHGSGGFVHQWAGGPDLTRSMDAILQCRIHHSTMAGGVHCLRQYFPVEANLLERLAWRLSGVGKEVIYESIGVSKATGDRMVAHAVTVIADYLDAWVNNLTPLVERGA